MVGPWQEFFYENRTQSLIWKAADFVKLAESYGHVGMRIENPSDLKARSKEAFSPKLKERFVFMIFLTDQKKMYFQ